MLSRLITVHEPGCAYLSMMFIRLSGNDSGVIFCRFSGARSHHIGLAHTVIIDVHVSIAQNRRSATP
jgi:hypothetical protein